MPSFDPSASAHYSQYPDFTSRYQPRPSAYESYRSNGYNTYASNSVHDLNALLPDPYQYKTTAQNAHLEMPSTRYGPDAAAAHALNAAAPYPFVPLPNPWSDYSNTATRGRRRPDGNGYYHEQQDQQQQQQQQQQQKEEKPVGGVSATLDYDMEQMTSFVAHMAEEMYVLYALYPNLAVDIDPFASIRPGTAASPDFRKWVLQVLNATRLPSATILLSLSYMSIRARELSASGLLRVSSRTVYSMLTVALILGSKFLDDNTFQNKSWAEVSNIPTEELNRAEREWLIDFGHRLHYSTECENGFSSWEKQWKEYRAASAVPPNVPHRLNTDLAYPYNSCNNQRSSPYDQSFARSANSSFTVEDSYSESSYATPYTPYDPWCSAPRSAMDRSPASAPHSGPHTPEYYGHQNLWGPVDHAARRAPYYANAFGAYPSISSRAPTYASNSSASWTPSVAGSGSQAYWNCHGAACQCSNCRQTNLMSRYGPVVCG